jgi:hypothetical protein
MARTRSAVLENATSDPTEVLVVFDEDTTKRNVLLRDHATLKAELTATAAPIANPAWTSDAPADVPATIPNPARARAEANAFDAAEAQIEGPVDDSPRVPTP